MLYISTKLPAPSDVLADSVPILYTHLNIERSWKRDTGYDMPTATHHPPPHILHDLCLYTNQIYIYVRLYSSWCSEPDGDRGAATSRAWQRATWLDRCVNAAAFAPKSAHLCSKCFGISCSIVHHLAGCFEGSRQLQINLCRSVSVGQSVHGRPGFAVCSCRGTDPNQFQRVKILRSASTFYLQTCLLRAMFSLRTSQTYTCICIYIYFLRRFAQRGAGGDTPTATCQLVCPPPHTHMSLSIGAPVKTNIYIYISICVYICVCVYVLVL